MWNWMFLNVLMRLRFANVTSWRVTLTGSIGSSYGIHFAQCSVVDGFICSIDSYFYPTCTWNNFLFLTWIFNYYGLLVCIMWRVTSTESTGSSYGSQSVQFSVIDGFICSNRSYFYPTFAWKSFVPIWTFKQWLIWSSHLSFLLHRWRLYNITVRKCFSPIFGLQVCIHMFVSLFELLMSWRYSVSYPYVTKGAW